MTKILRQLFLATSLAVSICSCCSAADKNPTAARKGAQQAMKTYYMGRFAIDVPAEFKLAVQSHRFRLVEIVEYDNTHDAKQKWLEHLAKVEKLQKPRGISKIVIQDQQLSGLGKWAKGVLYYSDYMADDECNWDIFVSYGNSAALFSLKGLLDKQQSMLVWLQEVATAYRPNSELKLSGDARFYTRHGCIELPYKRQEQSYARFEGHPLGLKIEIHMSETHTKVADGLMQRLLAAVAMNFAPGLGVEKIRSTKRTVNGNDGEEVVLRLDEGRRKELRFGWEHAGKSESGDFPTIKIEMEAAEGDTSTKLAVWDQVLSTFRSANK